MKTLILAAAGATLAALPSIASAQQATPDFSPLHAATVWNSGQGFTGCGVFDGQVWGYDADCRQTIMFRTTKEDEPASFVWVQTATLQPYQTAPAQAFVFRDEYDDGQCAYLAVIKPSGQVNTHIDCNAN